MSYRIYCYTNKQTNQKYVGCTCRRYQSERSGKNGHNYKSSIVFYDAIQKYGWDNFVYSVLENNLTKEEGEVKERYWIKTLNTIYPNGYNLQSGGVSGKKYHNLISEHMSKSLTGRKMSEEVCHKLSEMRKGKTSPNKGKKRSFESNNKTSNSLKGHITSEATKQKQSKSNQGLLWWNNGVSACKSKTCPGKDYVRGMLLKFKCKSVCSL